MNEKVGLKRKRNGEDPESDTKGCQTKYLKQNRLETGTLRLTETTRPDTRPTAKLNSPLTRFSSPVRSASRPRSGRGRRDKTDGRWSPPAPPPPSPARLHPGQALLLRNWLLSGTKLTGGGGKRSDEETAERPQPPTSPVRIPDPTSTSHMSDAPVEEATLEEHCSLTLN